MTRWAPCCKATLVAVLLAAALPTATAQATAKLPPRLATLGRQMRELPLNSERLLIREAIQSPRAPGNSSGSFHDRKKAGSPQRNLQTHWLKPKVDEVSLSPMRAVDRVGAPGHGRIEMIQVGDREYFNSSVVGLPHDSPPWVWVKVGKPLDGLAAMAGKGQGSLIGGLQAEIAKARSAVEVGPAMVRGHPTTEFAVETSKRTRVLVRERSSGKPAKSKVIVRQQPIALHVFIAPDGLPLRIEEEQAFGKPLRVETVTEVLGTGMPVRVQAPPANETIGLAELAKRSKEEAAQAPAGKSKQ